MKMTGFDSLDIALIPSGAVAVHSSSQPRQRILWKALFARYLSPKIASKSAVNSVVACEAFYRSPTSSLSMASRSVLKRIAPALVQAGRPSRVSRSAVWRLPALTRTYASESEHSVRNYVFLIKKRTILQKDHS